MLSEVLKEREAQVELKRSIQGARQDVDKLLTDMQKQKDQEATQKEKEMEQQKKFERQAIAAGLKQKYGQKNTTTLAVYTANNLAGIQLTLKSYYKFIVFESFQIWRKFQVSSIKFKIIHIRDAVSG